MAKVSNKTADLVGTTIIEALNPMKARIKTLTYDNDKEFGWHARIDEAAGQHGLLCPTLCQLGARLQREL
jgi:IS30 family transposase